MKRVLETDIAFHEAMGDASGNRFLADAIRRQSRLRRLAMHPCRCRRRASSNPAASTGDPERIEAGDLGAGGRADARASRSVAARAAGLRQSRRPADARWIAAAG
jgi:DNA-binding GntR family transcriptional regulator